MYPNQKFDLVRISVLRDITKNLNKKITHFKDVKNIIIIINNKDFA